MGGGEPPAYLSVPRDGTACPVAPGIDVARVTGGCLRRYPSEVNETRLIAAARTDPDAFARLYDQSAPEVYRFAYSLVREPHRAEDLTAEAFRRALTRIGRYEDRGKPFSAWLFTIVRNLVRDQSRRSGREVPLLDHDTSEDGWIGNGMLLREQTAALRSAVARLSETQRTVVILRYTRDQSCREVAERLGKSEAAVKQLSYRAMVALRRFLEEDGHEWFHE